MQLYLNQSGHRWVNIVGPNNQRDKLTVRHNGKVRQYAVKYWEAIGNFAVPYIRIKGRTIQLRESSVAENQWTENNEENRKNRA